MSSVLFLSPDTYATRGGVQSYMRRLAEILSAYAARHGGVLDCVSLADGDYGMMQHPDRVSFGTFVGARGSKAAFAREAARVASGRKPGVVVVGHTGLAPVALGLHVAGLVPRYILVLHGWEAWQRLGALDRMAAARAGKIVCTTSYTCHEFCGLNRIPVERASVIALAVPESAGRGRAPSSATQRRARTREAGLRVLTVGRLVRGATYKGVDTLIEAVAWAKSGNVPVHLIVVGDGDDLPRLRRRVHECELDECVSFLGAVSDADLHRLYHDCDVFALPSKGEGFGIVFLEAMACGKPCIGGDHGGTPEVIENGRDGYLVQHGDVKQLADRLMRLARDPVLVRHMGERARRKVRERFSLSHMRDQWFSLLEQTESAAALARGAPELPRAAGA